MEFGPAKGFFTSWEVEGGGVYGILIDPCAGYGLPMLVFCELLLLQLPLNIFKRQLDNKYSIIGV